MRRRCQRMGVWVRVEKPHQPPVALRLQGGLRVTRVSLPQLLLPQRHLEMPYKLAPHALKHKTQRVRYKFHAPPPQMGSSHRDELKGLRDLLAVQRLLRFAHGVVDVQQRSLSL
jgi:hypothetical protein